MGGDAAALEIARPAIANFAGKISHMGGHGAGQATKACNQILNFSTMLGIAESITLMKRFGLDSDQLPAALSGGFADSKMLKEYGRTNAIGPNMGLARMMNTLAGYDQGRIDPSYAGTMHIALKDLGVILDLSRRVGGPTHIMSVFDNIVRTLHYQEPNPVR